MHELQREELRVLHGELESDGAVSQGADVRAVFPLDFVIDLVGIDEAAIVEGEAGDRCAVGVEDRYLDAAAAGGVNVQVEAIALELKWFGGECSARVVGVHGDETVDAFERRSRCRQGPSRAIRRDFSGRGPR